MTDMERAAISYRNDQQCIVEQAKRIRELETKNSILSMGLSPSAYEMQKRITELEKEVARLRGEKLKKDALPAIPGYIGKKFKNDSHGYGEHTMRDISLAMRRICFPPFEKPHYHSYRDGKPSKLINYTYALPINEMTEDQYSRYIEILDKVTDILAEYEYTGETAV